MKQSDVAAFTLGFARICGVCTASGTGLCCGLAGRKPGIGSDLWKFGESTDSAAQGYRSGVNSLIAAGK